MASGASVVSADENLVCKAQFAYLLIANYEISYDCFVYEATQWPAMARVIVVCLAKCSSELPPMCRRLNRRST